ncbi:SapC family protein [Thorsellia anophelis]|uniref:SapC protein n=1 Tax=Thorsellia anophelis DSM 18579 TaxID=1123402 RepID=A0A1I0FPA9_9GAMM|nr:SapC family protein [Thorsellia anophelis]SET59929.1 SapC protein [Thorsellia anophelis DSM 18579]
MQNTFPLFYKNPVVLNTQSHTELAIDTQQKYSFAEQSLSIPVVASEFMPLIRHYPIVFTQSDTPTAVVILGIKQGQNCFVQNGEWKANTYIPAYVRRYPFIFFDSKTEAGSKQFLAVDIDAENVIMKDSSLPADRHLFTETGEQTTLLQTALAFCENFHQQAIITQEFIAALQANNLLTPNTLTMKEEGGKEHKVDGFALIDIAKYQALSESVINEFQHKGWLALITLQIASQQNWQLLFEENRKLELSYGK